MDYELDDADLLDSRISLLSHLVLGECLGLDQDQFEELLVKKITDYRATRRDAAQRGIDIRGSDNKVAWITARLNVVPIQYLPAEAK